MLGQFVIRSDNGRFIPPGAVKANQYTVPGCKLFIDRYRPCGSWRVGLEFDTVRD